MKLVRLLALVFAFSASAFAVRAQGSAYGTVMIDNFGFTGTGYSSGGSYKATTGGVMGGGFYTFPSQSRFKAGIDGRVQYSPGYNGGSAYTAALRVGFVPNHNPLRPYFQLGGGVVSTQLNHTICSGFACSTTTSRVTSGAAQLTFGLDVRVSEHFDIRAIDYGADAAGSNGSTHANAAFLDAGVVYHFHPAKRS